MRDESAYYCRAQKLAKLVPDWFIKHIDDITWQRLSNVTDPQAKMETVKLTESDYQPRQQQPNPSGN